ncbi:MAG: hypothetical protein J3K34DRAFT_199250 [Monoraphidium minutum]|nr:MAG: hypothetical protein J3K34DRAFT_199250 [Monoraphidium minutum]
MDAQWQAHHAWQHQLQQQQRAAAQGMQQHVDVRQLAAELQTVARCCDDRLLRIEAWQACTDAGAEGVSQVLRQFQSQLSSMAERLARAEREVFVLQAATAHHAHHAPPTPHHATGNTATLVFDHLSASPAARRRSTGAATPLRSRPRARRTATATATAAAAPAARQARR